MSEYVVNEFELAGVELMFASKFNKEKKNLKKTLEVLEKTKQEILSKNQIVEDARKEVASSYAPYTYSSYFDKDITSKYWQKGLNILREYNELITKYKRKFPGELKCTVYAEHGFGKKETINITFKNIKELFMFLYNNSVEEIDYLRRTTLKIKYTILYSLSQLMTSSERARFKECNLYSAKFVSFYLPDSTCLFTFKKKLFEFDNTDILMDQEEFVSLVYIFSLEIGGEYIIRKRVSDNKYFITMTERKDIYMTSKGISEFYSFQEFLEEENLSLEDLINDAPKHFKDFKYIDSNDLGNMAKYNEIEKVEKAIKDFIFKNNEIVQKSIAIPVYYLEDLDRCDGLLKMYLNRRARNVKDLINLYEDEKFQKSIIASSNIINVAMQGMTNKVQSSLNAINGQLAGINSQLTAINSNQQSIQKAIDQQTKLIAEQTVLINQIRDVNSRGFAYMAVGLSNIEANVDSLNRQIRNLDLKVDVTVDNKVTIE